MTQKARPVWDVSEGSWTPTPIFPQLNEIIPDDMSLVTSSTTPGDVFEVQLAALAKPGAGPETLTVRLRKTDTPVAYAVCYLMQGSTLIAGRVFQPTLAFANYPMNLTPAEIAAITNYADLRLRVRANFQTTSGCSRCPTAPATWTFSTTGISPSQFNFNFALAYQSGCLWSQHFNNVGLATLQLASGIWTLLFSAGGITATYTIPDTSWNCMDCNLMTLQSTFGPTWGWPNTINICPG
jgi:hypothetical protein